MASTSVSSFFRSMFCLSYLTVRQSSSTLIAADVSLSEVSVTGVASIGMFY